MTRDTVVYVNGVRRPLPDGRGHVTLLDYLRGTEILPLGLPYLARIYFILNYHSDIGFIFVALGIAPVGGLNQIYPGRSRQSILVHQPMLLTDNFKYPYY